MRNAFIKGILNTRGAIDPLPIIRTAREYTAEKAAGDIRAGISVAMLTFSMSIAYAMIAGLPVMYGLFGGIAAAYFSCVFSSSRFIMFGPSNASAVMLMSAFASMGLDTEAQRVAAVSAIVLLVGAFLVIASLFKITNFVRYVSRTVVTGYITAGAMLIVANQLNSALGITSVKGSSGQLFSSLNRTFAHISDANCDAIGLSLAAIAILFACKRFFKKLPAQAVALVGAAAICAALKGPLGIEVAYLDSVTVSDWALTLPDFEAVPFRSLALAALAVSLFCVIESTSIGKSLAAKNAERLNTNQELFSLGMANIGASLLSGTVESGSLTRSAAGADAGTKTPFVNFFSATFMLAGILLFGSFIAYIPRPALSAVVIVIAFTLFSKKAIKLALRSTREDAVVFLLTFITGITSSLDDAIYIGVAASIILFLKNASAPEVVEVAIGDNGLERKLDGPEGKEAPEISIVHVGGNLFFGASDVFQDQMRRIYEAPSLKVLLLKLRNAINFDATSAADLEEIAIQMRKRGGVLYLCEVMPDVMAALKSSGVAKTIGEENIFANTEENPTLSTALALRAAKKYLSGKSSDVQIFV